MLFEVISAVQRALSLVGGYKVVLWWEEVSGRG